LQDRRGLLRGSIGGSNSAQTGFTEADSDAAMALLMAENRWGERAYGVDARRIVRAIRDHYIVKVDDKVYLAAGDWAISNEQVIFAPAAFAPAAYHLFAAADPGYDWWYLLDSNYDLLSRVTTDPLGEERSAGLPPAYVGIDRATGALLANPKGAPRSANSFDAYAAQVYWRIALDARLHQDGRALSFLRASSFLSDEWQRKQALNARYAHQGTPQSKEESLALYSALLPRFAIDSPTAANQLFALKLAPSYHQQRAYGLWGDGNDVDLQRLAFIASGLYGKILNDDWSNRAPEQAPIVPKSDLHGYQMQ